MGDRIRTPEAEIERLYRQTAVSGEFPSVTPAFLKLAADAALRWGGTDEGRRVRSAIFEILDAAYPALAEPARQQLIQMLVDRLGPAAEEALASLFADFVQERFGAELERLARARAGRRRVVFVARRPYFQILREALHLKRRGYQVVLVSLTALPDDLKAMFEKTFDEAFEPTFRLPEHPGALLGMLRRLEADIVHVQCWMLDYALARLVLEHRGRARVVCEFYDITSVVAERDVLAAHWPPELVDLDLHSEGYICREADAVVGRYPEAIAAELRARHGGPARFLEMHPYPSPELAAPAPERARRRGGKPRLVYTGIVVPEDGACPPELYPEFHQRRTFERLLRQGLALDVLLDPARPLPLDEPPPGYAGFLELAKRFPGYSIRNGYAPDRLAQALGDYDFGIVNLTQFDTRELRVRPSLLRYAVGTKLFAYLEAELPVLVNAEYEYMASIVERHGLGLIVHSRELDDVAARIAAFDRDRAIEAIRRFNREHAMAREIERLDALYAELLGAPA